VQRYDQQDSKMQTWITENMFGGDRPRPVHLAAPACSVAASRGYACQLRIRPFGGYWKFSVEHANADNVVL
jgi:hypothetical protein